MPPKSKEVTLNYRLSRMVHKHGLYQRQGTVSDSEKDFRAVGQEAGLPEPDGLFVGKGFEDGDVRLPGLRRLQPARLRLSLSQAMVLEVRAQRPVRRFGQRPLRIGRQGMHSGRGFTSG